MVLELEALKKSFGRSVAVDGVTLSVDHGETLCILGPTGAGKTTLLRLCAGVLEPDAGRVRIFKIDPTLDRRRAQERLGYVPAGAPVDENLSPWTYLHFLAAARGYDAARARHAVRDAAGLAGLDREILKEGRRLTSLERRQVALAAALLPEPLLLLLDEPFAGLDEADAERFAVRLAQLATPERALVIAASTRALAERLATRTLELAAGRLAAPGAAAAAGPPVIVDRAPAPSEQAA